MRKALALVLSFAIILSLPISAYARDRYRDCKQRETEESVILPYFSDGSKLISCKDELVKISSLYKKTSSVGMDSNGNVVFRSRSDDIYLVKDRSDTREISISSLKFNKETGFVTNLSTSSKNYDYPVLYEVSGGALWATTIDDGRYKISNLLDSENRVCYLGKNKQGAFSIFFIDTNGTGWCLKDIGNLENPCKEDAMQMNLGENKASHLILDENDPLLARFVIREDGGKQYLHLTVN